MKKIMICIGMAAALVGCAPKEEKPVEQPQPKEEFKYLPNPGLGPADTATEELHLLFG